MNLDGACSIQLAGLFVLLALPEVGDGRPKADWRAKLSHPTLPSSKMSSILFL